MIDRVYDKGYCSIMKTINTKPEFKNLAEEEIMQALDQFESAIEEKFGADLENLDEDDFPEIEPEDPIVFEVSRLISEYTNRFDQYCENLTDEDILTSEIFDYEPEIMIERIAYEIFLDAVHDAIQEDDNFE